MQPTISSPVDEAIVRRRTNLRMDLEREVSAETIQELCELGVWAPNHKRTEPWRFAAFVGDGRERLGNTVADAMASTEAPPERVAKTRTKYLRAPATLLVGSMSGENPLITDENRDACAASVQNILLGATDRGLASFWSSVAVPTAPTLLELCGFDRGTYVIAAIYLGYPTADMIAPERCPPIIEWVTE